MRLRLDKVNISENFFHDKPYNESMNPVVHLSDALRVLLVWKFGGIYLDTDYVVLNDMTHYQNFLVNNDNEMKAVTNNAFSFTPGHSFIDKVINKLHASYDPKCWKCVGPGLFTKCLKEYKKEKKLNEVLTVEPMERYVKDY